MKNFLCRLCFLLMTASPLFGQLNPQNISIPMRDGKQLAAHLYLPDETGTFPVILIQTPYNKNFFQFIGLPLGVGYDMSASDYAFVILDWRCFFGSLQACTPQTNRGEDGYDAVEWIAAQPWSNGKVGTWGPSALGNVQFSTAYEQPPHLVCAVPVVAAPWENYHKYYPGGSLAVEYLQTLQTLFGDFSLVINNPYYNLLWQIAENTTMNPEQVRIPMLLIAGWFDHNTEWDMILIDTLAAASDPEVRDRHKILIGPWVHGGTGPAAVGTVQQGELSFPQAAGWNEQVALAFFDFYLREVDNGWEDRERYLFFQMGEHEWRESAVWPPEGVALQTYYLSEDGSMDAILPAAGSLSFSYDPEDPSPTIGGKTLSADLLQGPYDQSEEVETRNDALIFSTPVLAEDLRIQGKISVDLYVSSDRPDTDIALRLTDVYPDGRSILLGESIQRMRFRNGFRQADEAFLQPGVVYPVTLAFDDLAVTFPAGHRLRLIVSSANYPRYNRNMNTGAEMYPNGHIDTLVNAQIAENTLHLGGTFPSRLQLPLAESPNAVFSQENPEEALLIYPNPVADRLTIAGWETGPVVIYDLTGKQVGFWNKPSGSLVVGGLPPGVYLVRITTPQGTVVRKIVKR